MFPVVLVGAAFWGPLVDWLRNTVAASGRVNEQDLELFTVVDSPQEALDVIKEADRVRRAAHHNGHVYGSH